MKDQEEMVESAQQHYKRKKPSKSRYQYQEHSKKGTFLPHNFEGTTTGGIYQSEWTIKAQIRN